MEHPQEQHRQRTLQSEDARAVQRAAQHPAEDVRGAGVLRAAGEGCRHARPVPAYGEVASCSGQKETIVPLLPLMIVMFRERGGNKQQQGVGVVVNTINEH